MKKTPQELAEEYGNGIIGRCFGASVMAPQINCPHVLGRVSPVYGGGKSDILIEAERGFIAGYEARDNAMKRDFTDTYSHGTPEQQIANEFLKKKGVSGNLLAYAENRFIDGYLFAKEKQGDANKWISVKDRLPEPMAIVAIIANDDSVDEGPSMCMGWHYGHLWSTFNRCCTYISDVPKVSHWMLLPEFPLEDKQAGKEKDL